MPNQQPTTETPQGKVVHANGIDIYYEEHGAGEPLLLLHGGTLTCRQWDDHMPTFAQHFHVFALDTRGHGKTHNPGNTFSYRTLAADVAAFIHALQLDRPLILGFSDGGHIALAFGIRYAELTRALVLGAATSRLTESHLRWKHDVGFEGPHAVNIERMERDHVDLVDFWKAHHTLEGPDSWRTLVDSISVMWYSPFGYSEADLRGATAPTLLALGDRDGVVPVEEAVYMYRLMPNAELAITPHAEHFFPDTSHPLFGQILDFLVRHREVAEA